MSLCDQNFFGLTEDYRENIHEQIFELTYHTNMDPEYVLNLPVGLRRWYVKQLEERLEEEKEQIEEQKSNT